VLGGDLPPFEAAEKSVVTEAGPEFFDAALAAYTETGADLGQLARELKARTGRKGAGLYMPLRLALTGRHDGPELATLLPAIPEALVRLRLANAARMRQG
jgi:glutamyl-tRNA synthetase